MRIRSALVLGTMLILSVGCGQSDRQAAGESAPPAAAADATEPATSDDQELNRAIQQPQDKARALEDQLMKDKEQTDAEIDEQSD